MKKAAEIVGKLLLLALMISVALIIILIIYFLAVGFNESTLEAVAESKWQIYLQMAVFMLAATLIYALFERKRGWSLGLKQPKGGAALRAGLLLGAVMISLSALLIWSFGGMEWEWIGFRSNVLRSLLDGFILFACVAVYEEFFSRGYLQGLIQYHFGSLTAIIVSSVLFTAMHSFNPGMTETPIPIINLLLVGILLAYTRKISGGIWMPVGIHFTWNWFQGCVYGFKVSGTELVPSLIRTTITGPVPISGGSFGIEGSYIATLITVLAIIAVWSFNRTRLV
ncbi:CPBP family intramembrane metalloprotease [Paenibacillus sp. N4]|uniref:CPBP family intramembrane glutamic endopeptidase n=1 Tax=Paenibacillus vietnamensis TaxID=2590547 RepID=UPI001CD179FE|nr:CPBP family intramembrane glutamic endopeptidase [Paenibacillus vietnamensis]MCA0758732.1 CPBP family intramembrane metalloprotease [Paenibacillus vietnamensis]